jgi:hypothetical protein
MHRFDPARDYALGLFRIGVGFLFTCHGAKTLFGVLGAKAPTTFDTWPGWFPEPRGNRAEPPATVDAGPPSSPRQH